MLASLIETRVVQDPKWNQWAAGGDVLVGANSAAGMPVNDVSAMQLITVFGCVSFIANGISLLPVDVFRDTNGVQNEIQSPSWMEEPNQDLSGSELRNQFVVSLLLDGNFYCIPVRNAMGQVLEVWPLHPRDVRVYRWPGQRPVYWVYGQQLGPDEIMHIRGATLPGEIVGMSPITACRNVIGTGLALEEYSGRWFSQGSTPSGIIETDQASGAVDAGMVRDQFEQFHRGVRNSHGVAVLTGGATYKPITISNKDSQFLEAKNFSASQIASCMFQLEPEMVGASMTGRTSLTYKNLQDRWLDIKLRAFMPYTSRLEEMLTRLLPRPQKAKLDYEEYLRADVGERYTAYQTGLASGFLTIEEVRAEEDLPPLGSVETEPVEPDQIQPGLPVPPIATLPPQAAGV